MLLSSTAPATQTASGVRHLGRGWSQYESARAAARTRWEQQYATEQAELNRLRAATAISHDSVARNRGPRDNDKFIYQFKGGGVDRALARRKKAAEHRLGEAEAKQLRKPPTSLRFQAPLVAPAEAVSVIAAHDLRVEGRLSLPKLVVASHDRHLRRTWAGTELVLSPPPSAAHVQQ